MEVEKVLKISDRIRLSISSEREDKYKIMLGRGDTFLYLSEEEMASLKEVV